MINTGLPNAIDLNRSQQFRIAKIEEINKSKVEYSERLSHENNFLKVSLIIAGIALVFSTLYIISKESNSSNKKRMIP